MSSSRNNFLSRNMYSNEFVNDNASPHSSVPFQAATMESILNQNNNNKLNMMDKTITEGIFEWNGGGTVTVLVVVVVLVCGSIYTWMLAKSTDQDQVKTQERRGRRRSEGGGMGKGERKTNKKKKLKLEGGGDMCIDRPKGNIKIDGDKSAAMTKSRNDNNGGGEVDMKKTTESTTRTTTSMNKIGSGQDPTMALSKKNSEQKREEHVIGNGVESISKATSSHNNDNIPQTSTQEQDRTNTQTKTKLQPAQVQVQVQVQDKVKAKAKAKTKTKAKAKAKAKRKAKEKQRKIEKALISTATGITTVEMESATTDNDQKKGTK
ncbi:regulator of chromosome condensation, partial [Reticulomyxa filosa]